MEVHHALMMSAPYPSEVTSYWLRGNMLILINIQSLLFRYRPNVFVTE